MKKIMLAGLLCLAAGITALRAQDLDTFKQQLQQPGGEFQSRVEVREHGVAASTVGSLQARPAGESIRGFRVCIYTGNSQDARAKAQEAQKKFNELYPEIPSYIRYTAPDFKVLVGNCLTMEEAIMLKGRIGSAFVALVTQEDIDLALFGRQPEGTPADSVAAE